MNSSYVVGIDIGGQTSKLGVVDARGTVLAQTVIRTDTYSDVAPYIVELAEAVRKIIKEAGAEGNIRGVGVGAPNGNYYTGQIESAPNLPWAREKVEFAKLLTEALDGLPAVKIHCSVLAEQAIKAALADYYTRQGIDPEPIVGKIEDHDHHDSCSL